MFFFINIYTVTVNSFANPILYYTRTFRSVLPWSYLWLVSFVQELLGLACLIRACLESYCSNFWILKRAAAATHFINKSIGLVHHDYGSVINIWLLLTFDIEPTCCYTLSIRRSFQKKRSAVQQDQLEIKSDEIRGNVGFTCSEQTQSSDYKLSVLAASRFL